MVPGSRPALAAASGHWPNGSTRGVAADCGRVLPDGHPLTKSVRQSLQAIADD